MITLCPSPADKHAPFAHRLVKPRIKVVKRVDKTYEVSIMPMSPTFVICALCDHWVKRKVTKCACPVDCHNQ